MLTDNLDILLINIPISGLQYPPAGTSQLKGSVVDAGFTCTILDLNLDLFNKTGSDYSKFFDYFSEATHGDPEIDARVDQILDSWVDDMIKINPRFVGISVFTMMCQLATRMFTKKLKQKYTGKIVIGGAGISTNGIASAYNDFGAEMLNLNQIDYFIRGDGEIALVELLTGNDQYPGINNDSYKQLSLDTIPFPEYDDLIELNYQYDDGLKMLPINGSRGCVRACSFCDIHEHWKKFTFRSGHVLAEEMITNYEQYGVTQFTFTDSLINGSMKAFRQLLFALIEYYEKNNLPDAHFRFNGQFIVRSLNQQTPKDYQLMARAGCTHVMIGTETGSDRVREHMRKQFTTAELAAVIDQLDKNDLNCFFSMICGYPTERQEDHQQTLDMFTNFKKYALNGTITGLNLGATLSVDEGTPLFNEMTDLGLMHLGDTGDRVGLNWLMPDNPDLTLRERIRRRIELQEHVVDLGYHVWNADSHLKRLKISYEKIANGTY